MSVAPGATCASVFAADRGPPDTVNATRSRLRLRPVRLVAVVLGVAALLAFVIAALVCYKTGSQPGDIRWLDGARPSGLVAATLRESRHEIVALGLAALNLTGLLVYLHALDRRPHEEHAPEAGGTAPTTTDVRTTLSTTAVDLVLDASPVPSTDTSATDPEPLAGRSAGSRPASEAAPAAATTPPARGCSNGNDEAQLRIATAELSRLRRELAGCRRQLDASDGTRSRFLANMSHELRTPMNGIIGMTDLLLGGELPPRERRFAQSIAVSSNALLGIISDLLDFSNIESGTLNLERARFRVRDAVEDVCAMLAERAHEKGIELMCYVDDNVPVLADGDASRLRQVIDNLVRNAIAFTDEGEVVVRLSREESDQGRSLYRCDVQDTGSGISPEMQMTMFDAFTQEDGSSTRRHGGLGMGLAIVRELVTLMGGSITFRSRLGEGTRFGFTVALEDVGDASGEEAPRRDIRGARVLVVDDNETNRTILYHQLSGWGVLADTVDGGEAALARLHEAVARDAPYDLLVLDLHMPGMDGLELARRIAAEPALDGIRSLMLTSAVLELDDEELAALGIDRYVSKPPRQSVLHESLVSLLPSGDPSGRAIEPLRPPLAPMAPIGARVLLAEDNLVSQDVGVGLLERAGCRVDVVSDGREAIERAGCERYDLILMDCRMPGIDGYAATGAIRTGSGENARTPIVALTASAMQGDRERCLGAGMDDYLAKPVRQGELNATLRRWVVLEESGAPTGGRDEASPDTRSCDPSRRDADVAGTVTTPSQENVSSPRLDTEAIEAIRALQRPGRPDLLAKVLGTFLDRTPAILEAVRRALDEDDMRELGEQMHSLGASSAYVGAARLAERCRGVERAIEKGDTAAVAAAVARIDEEFRAVADELGALGRVA